MAASNRVAGNSRISVTDVRPRVDVINRSRDVERFAHFTLGEILSETMRISAFSLRRGSRQPWNRSHGRGTDW